MQLITFLVVLAVSIKSVLFNIKDTVKKLCNVHSSITGVDSVFHERYHQLIANSVYVAATLTHSIWLYLD